MSGTIAYYCAAGGAALVTLYEFIRARLVRKRESAVKLALTRNGRMLYSELWLQTKLSEKQLKKALEELETNHVIRCFVDPQTSQQMVELWYHGSKEGRFKSRF